METIEFNNIDKQNLGKTLKGELKTRYRRLRIARHSLLALILVVVVVSPAIQWWNEPILAICNEKCEKQRIDNYIPDQYSKEWWTMYCNDMLGTEFECN